jgi:predicted metal-dependent phosphoesterase TrpH
MLAITDHDNTDAFTQLKPNSIKGIKLISGIEFSTTWNKIGVHIVGLNFDLKSKAINKAVQSQKSFRDNRAKTISKKLEKCGLVNGYEKISKINTSQIGRPNFAQLLVEEGICIDIKHAFKKYLGAGKIGDVKNQWLSFEEIIDSIRLAGGIAVLAHPLAYKLTNSKLKKLIADFKSYGGQGIETINGYQNRDKINYLESLCKEFNLKASIGSDFHRPNNWAKLGTNTDLVSDVETVWEGF